MDPERNKPTSTKPDRGEDGGQHMSDKGLAITFGALAVALVLGYLLLSKLVDMSREEDCILAGRRNCAPGIEVRPGG